MGQAWSRGLPARARPSFCQHPNTSLKLRPTTGSLCVQASYAGQTSGAFDETARILFGSEVQHQIGCEPVGSVLGTSEQGYVERIKHCVPHLVGNDVKEHSTRSSSVRNVVTDWPRKRYAEDGLAHGCS